MAGIIYLNGSNSIQPSEVKEELQQKVHDRVSIKGTYTRIWMAQKHIVTLKFKALVQSDYATLINYCTGSAKTISYQNINSGFNFSGFAKIAEDTYYQGASLLKDMTIEIVEK